jgi:hypothetical protein
MPVRNYTAGGCELLVNAARHPRPLLRRDGWLPLDGDWDFAIHGEARWSGGDIVGVHVYATDPAMQRSR